MMVLCLSFLTCKMDGTALGLSVVLNVSAHEVLRTLLLLMGNEP